MDVQPIDQAIALLHGQQLVPDFFAQAVQQRQLGIQEQQAQSQANQINAAQARQVQQQTALTNYRTRLAGFGPNPTAAQLSSLIAEFPEFSEDIRRAYDAQDEQERNSVFNETGQAFSAARAGRPDLALQVLERRVTAGRARGQEPDPITSAAVEALRDPNRTQEAERLLYGMVQAISGSEHIGSVTSAIRPQTAEIDGRVIRTDPYDPRAGEGVAESPYPRIVAGPNGAFYEQPRIGVGGQSAAPQQIAPPQRPRSLQEAQGYPPGTPFIDPRDGRTIRIVPGGQPPAAGNFPGADSEQGWWPTDGRQ